MCAVGLSPKATLAPRNQGTRKSSKRQRRGAGKDGRKETKKRADFKRLIQTTRGSKLRPDSKPEQGHRG